MNEQNWTKENKNDKRHTNDVTQCDGNNYLSIELACQKH